MKPPLVPRPVVPPIGDCPVFPSMKGMGFPNPCPVSTLPVLPQAHVHMGNGWFATGLFHAKRNAVWMACHGNACTGAYTGAYGTSPIAPVCHPSVCLWAVWHGRMPPVLVYGTVFGFCSITVCGNVCHICSGVYGECAYGVCGWHPFSLSGIPSLPQTDGCSPVPNICNGLGGFATPHVCRTPVCQTHFPCLSSIVFRVCHGIVMVCDGLPQRHGLPDGVLGFATGGFGTMRWAVGMTGLPH